MKTFPWPTWRNATNNSRSVVFLPGLIQLKYHGPTGWMDNYFIE